MSCDASAKWGVASSVKQKNPDGTHLTLYTCDSHYSNLTVDLKKARTRYALFPVGESHMTPPVSDEPAPEPEEEEEEEEEDAFEKKINEGPLVARLLFKGMIVTVGFIIGPFIAVYFGVRWLFGWRLPEEK